MKKKVFVCRFHQESNNFNPAFATIDDFHCVNAYEDGETKGGAVLSGTIDALKAQDAEIIGGVSWTAPSGAPLKTEVVERFIAQTVDALKNAEGLDGVIVSLHGATTSEESDDVCGDVLQAVRETVGEACLISASFDLHANITEKIMQNADLVCGYQAYPHLDLYETGYRSAKLLLDRLNGTPLKTVRVAIPMIAPAHAYTTVSGELFALTERAKAFVQSGKIADFTIFQAQPWLDVAEFASTIVVVAEDETVAKTVAEDLAQDEFSIRHDLLGMPLLSVEAVIDKALKYKSGKPIVLVDSADSPNAGACGDSAFVLQKLLPYKDELRCAVAVRDCKAVKKAFSAGVGAVLDFMLGATIAPKLTKPVLVQGARVRSLHDGKYIFYGPQERGKEFNAGKTAVLEVGKILIHVAEEGARGDLAFYRSFGIAPEFCDLVSVKACTSFRAGYTAIAEEICNSDTLGAAGGVLNDLPYEKRPIPMFPFEDITEAQISKAKRYR